MYVIYLPIPTETYQNERRIIVTTLEQEPQLLKDFEEYGDRERFMRTTSDAPYIQIGAEPTTLTPTRTDGIVPSI
jgi:hypothetical protein